MTGFKYPKGSEWRKWDLHVHTPASALNNQFEGTGEDEKWTKYLTKLASLTNISVLGLTDYFSIEGFKKVRAYKDAGHLSNIDFLLPNVELRILPVTSEETPINLHIIFSPEPEIIDGLESKFFSSLEFKYQGEVFKCIRDDLINLGRRYKNDSSIQENIAYKIGIEQFKISFDKIKEIITKDRLLLEKSLVIVSNRSEDGASGIQHSSLAATREEIYRFANCIFSSNPSDRDYFLGKGVDTIEGIIRKYGCLKPCIHGSDAHSLDKVCCPDLSRFTWIKADPTFNGLKQILYEPEERVYIGEDPPILKLERDKIIKSIAISKSNKWFEDDKPMPLNEGLISVIGGKGSGKTAILDVIAYATDSYKCYEKDETKSKSFLKKAFRELKGTKFKIEWDEGKPDEKEVGNKLEEATKEGKVRYLPQDYVDQLCSEIGKDELEQQIENVIFQNIPSENKAHFSDFKSYRDTQLKVINDKKSRVTKQIADINSKIFDYKELIESKAIKNRQIKEFDDEIKKLKAETDKISEALKDSDGQKKILGDLNFSIEQKTSIERTISELKTILLKIEEIGNEISVFLEGSKEFTNKLKGDPQTIGITKANVDLVKVILFPENLQQILDSRKNEIEKEIEKQKGELEKLDKNIKDLNGKITLEKSKQDKIKEINQSSADFKKKKDSLTEDIEKVEELEKKLPGLLQDRKNLFINYFELIFEEKEKLKEIYSPLEIILKESSEENEKLFDFTVQFNFDVETMSREGDKLIDHSNAGRFLRSDRDALKAEIEQLKLYLNLNNEKLSLEDSKLIREFLENVEKLFLQDDRGNHYTINSQLRKEYTGQDFDNWLYSTKYYGISYSIKFNGLELDNLSPGLKGVALLILFLDLDEEDKRPILIDQPEENLDNRSVFKTLMRYFGNARKRRQVIIVTHNPNLVVNTDAEQIIVADFDRGLEQQSSRIGYVSGSLENTFKDDAAHLIIEKQRIREHVCEILEGGQEAFEKRERKYGFKIS